MTRRDYIRVRIHWKDTETGAEGIYTDPPGGGVCWIDEDGEFVDYIWTDGNYACDCNRALLFTDVDGHPCGSSRFEIVSMEPIA